MSDERESCPACGGSGGGPFGRPGSVWDDESYLCFRCEGEGRVRVVVASPRPLAKATGEAPPVGAAKPSLAQAKAAERPKKHRAARG